MKVLALNSSPRAGGQSKTELMLTHLVKGMQDAGAEVQIVHLREKTVRHCAGCFTCWTKTPGICIHKDDMTKELYPSWLESDLVVYATPLYHFHMNATMKAFIERTLPCLEPFFQEGEDRTHHPLRTRHPKMVFLSVAGFPEEAIFDQLSAWVNSVYGPAGLVAAEIYRPSAETMTHPFLKEKKEDILAATYQAGREIVESMQIAPQTLARIKQEIVTDKNMFHRMGNLFWKTCIAEGVSPKEFEEKGLIPRPDSIDSFLMIMSMGFNAEAARDTHAVMQFNFSGEVQGSGYLEIQDGKLKAKEGTAGQANILIESPFEIWMDIMTGKADGQKLFMEQKYQIKGDLNLLLRMKELFSR
jgi:multimeric flavodoxin WrbA/putative sterol carrier protein